MRKRLVVPAVLLAAVAQSASASVVYDGFDYPAGKLAGNTNPTAPANSNGFTDTNVWTKSGTATNDSDVVIGSLSYANAPSSVGNMAQLTGAGGTSQTADRIAIPDHPSGSTIYFSMIFQVPSGVTNYGTSTTTGSFFTGFQYNPDVIGTTTNGMNDGVQSSGAPLTVRKATDGLGYNLGIGYRDTAAVRVFDSTDELTAGQTHFLVGKYEIGTGSHDDVATLYIDPDLSTGVEPTSASAVSANTAASTTADYFYSADGATQLETNIRSFILRSNGVEPSSSLVDELRIGDNWTDVTTAAAPEPASVSLLALGALGLMGRRRKR